MQRLLEPELLDSLPHTHPDALHSRRDLRLTNRMMRNHAWIADRLPRLIRPGERALEIGAGTGELGLELARQGAPVDGLDLWPRPDAWPSTQVWHRTDLRTFDRWDDYRVVFGTLIFHQFSDAELRALGKKLRRVRVVLACEPARARVSQIMFAAIAPLFGANHVTRHDAHVSIAAGFRDNELASVLGLTHDDWDIRWTASMGAYRMAAVRKT